MSCFDAFPSSINLAEEEAWSLRRVTAGAEEEAWSLRRVTAGAEEEAWSLRRVTAGAEEEAWSLRRVTAGAEDPSGDFTPTFPVAKRTLRIQTKYSMSRCRTCALECKRVFFE